MTIAAVAVVVLLAGGITWVIVDKSSAKSSASEKLQAWVPTADNRDPSTKIPGIYVGARTDEGAGKAYAYGKYVAAIHVTSDQRVAYDRFPPVGGPHDQQWADCQGVVYDKPVRDENMVHTLEHGAVWIAYNPETVTGAELDTLKAYVTGQNYITLTPYTGLKANISLQGWAHQLQVASASDERIAQFITALRQNQYVYPETGARCDSPGWDSANPYPLDTSPRTSADVQMDGKGAAAATDEAGVGASDSSGAESSGAASSGAASSGAESSGAASSGAASSGAESSGAASSGAQSSGAESSSTESSSAPSSGAASSSAAPSSR
ncbi:DUF3105 domain-containing protein [Nakamurella sp. A5-74]|uniref:DUF3105 domain-containing protein n=1 Tax=Nakamurella sp. A5-74 TaxID=3158264 RepID=A0AAU8DJV4_9ACTN